MICGECGRQNLPGGVRCVYCGAPFPRGLEFDVNIGFAPGAPGNAAAPADEARPKRSIPVGLLGGIVLLALKGKSLLAMLQVGKLAITFGTMWLSIQVWSLQFGWSLAAGVVVSIFIHEMGHVVMNWRHGLKTSPPIFIPFVGAVIMVKYFPDDPRVESECGAGGPAAGLLAAAGCTLLGLVTGNGYWHAVAFLGYAINLANLVPFWQLDGARISSAMGARNWDFVLLALLLVVLKAPSAPLWILLIALFVLRLGRPQHGRHNLASPVVRARTAAIYVGLCLSLAYGFEHAYAAAPPIGSFSRGAAAQTNAQPAAPAVSPAPAARSAAVPDPTLSAVQRTALIVLSGVALVLGFGVWLLAAYLLALAAGEPVGARGQALAGAMVGLLVLICLSFAARNTWAPSMRMDGPWLIGAWWAAAGAAVCFAGYHAAQASGRLLRPQRDALTWRCLAWSAGAALAVAYAAESAWVVGWLLAAAAMFYARRPWLLVSASASAWDILGEVERSIGLRRGALRLNPDPGAARLVRGEIADSCLILDRGEQALEAEGAEAAPQPPNDVPSLTSAGRRAGAFARLGRFEDALRECERILQSPPGDRLGTWRPIFVHRLLAEVMLFREWPDEARAQAQCVLNALPRAGDDLAREAVAAAHRVRAAAEVELGDSKRANAEIRTALQWGRNAAYEPLMALLRAQAALRAGDAGAAEKETAGALRKLPGSLAVRYWRGRALAAVGRDDEGARVLRALADEFPREYWGVRAAAGIA